MAIIRYLCLACLKIIGRVLYPAKLRWLTPQPPNWHDVSLILILNHTSLAEFLYGVKLPLSFMKALSQRLVIPVASDTLKNPIACSLFSLLAAKVIGLTRNRDASWQQFLKSIDNKDICIFMPEGEMKRPNGLNKHGKPMTVKTGVFDLLQRYQRKNMVIVYGHGLHHVFAPGDRFPKIFRRISADLEYLKVADYLEKFASIDSGAAKAQAIANELEERRNTYCPPGPNEAKCNSGRPPTQKAILAK